MENRHFFTVGVNLNVVAPKKLGAPDLASKIDELIEKYLNEEFKVSKIMFPQKPGMPEAGYIYELRDKMEDIR